MIKNIQDTKDINGKRVLLRSTLNVPIKNAKIINNHRLRKSLETIKFLRKSGAKIILTGHIGKDGQMSLYPIYEYFQEYFPISFTKEVLGKSTKSAVEKMNNGDIILLENLRSHKGEQANDNNFARELSSLADIYVNDAFSASHREHASIVGVPEFLPNYAGILFQREINELSSALSPASPSLCILGGAKFTTKEPLIEKLVDIYDKVFISGALAHDFFKNKGFNIGISLSGNISIDEELINNEKIMIPIDVTVQNKDGIFIKKPNKVGDEDNIKDSGPETVKELEQFVRNFKFVLWNGPLGEYERGFIKPTETLARAIAESPARTLIGGGDTIAAIEHLGLEDKFSFVSTGGGAMLKFLLDGTLVGIKALKRSS
jgi:phosphoglycerate kinase